MSDSIGEIEIVRMRETHQHGTRRGKSFSIDRQTEPLVMHSEISGLPDKHAFLKLGNNVARFSFTYTDLPATSAAFRPRAVEDDELTFDPLTLEQRGASVQQCMAADEELLADPEDQPTDKEKQEQGSIEVSDTTAPPAAAVASARSRQRTRSLFRCEGRTPLLRLHRRSRQPREKPPVLCPCSTLS